MNGDPFRVSSWLDSLIQNPAASFFWSRGDGHLLIIVFFSFDHFVRFYIILYPIYTYTSIIIHIHPYTVYDVCNCMYCIYPISHNFTAVIAGYTISSRPNWNLWAILPGVVSSCNVRIDSHILQSSPCGGCLLQICSTASLKPFFDSWVDSNILYLDWFSQNCKIGSIPTSKGLQHSSYRNNVVYNIAGAAFSVSQPSKDVLHRQQPVPVQRRMLEVWELLWPARSEVIFFFWIWLGGRTHRFQHEFFGPSPND